MVDIFCSDDAMEKLRPCIAEFIGTFALIFVGIGAIKTAGHDVLGGRAGSRPDDCRFRFRHDAYLRRPP